MDLERLTRCNICMGSYAGVVRPHTLNCGHSVCGSCIGNSITTGMLLCPDCHKTHMVNSADAFHVTYGMEALILEINNGNLIASPNCPPKYSNQTTKSGRKLDEFLGNLKDSLKMAVKNSEEMELHIINYQDNIRKSKGVYEYLVKKINDLGNQSEELAIEFESEDGELRENVNEIINTSDEESESTSDEDEQYFDGLEELGIPSTIQKENTIDTMSSNEMIALPTKSEYVRALLKTGHVYAVHNEGGTIRSARISIYDNNIYLHYLKNKIPPFHAHTIKYSDLISALDIDSIVTFLDFYWHGCNQGRVHISLSPGLASANHFLMMCTGQLGPSYAHTHILEVQDKGTMLGEAIFGGDYEFNDGTGGAALISGLTPEDDVNKREFSVGSVYTRYYDPSGSKMTQFGIKTTYGINPYYMDHEYGVFGHLTDGLHIVREVAKLAEICQVKIANCGVLLPF